jgi:hypothetical protein
LEQLAIGMHAYAIDSGERRTIPLLLAGLSILAALGLHRLLALLDFALPWWIDTPSVIGFYAVFYGVFDKWIWSIQVLRRVGLRTVDLRGLWQGYLTSSFDDNATQMKAEARIQQTWTQIGVKVSTESSESLSSIGAITTDPSEGVTLNYEYLNQPKASSRATMQIHRGFARLTVAPDGRTLEGDYYTGRGRTTYGRLHLRKD